MQVAACPSDQLASVLPVSRRHLLCRLPVAMAAITHTAMREVGRSKTNSTSPQSVPGSIGEAE